VIVETNSSSLMLALSPLMRMWRDLKDLDSTAGIHSAMAVGEAPGTKGLALGFGWGAQDAVGEVVMEVFPGRSAGVRDGMVGGCRGEREAGGAIWEESRG